MIDKPPHRSYFTFWVMSAIIASGLWSAPIWKIAGYVGGEGGILLFTLAPLPPLLILWRGWHVTRKPTRQRPAYREWGTGRER